MIRGLGSATPSVSAAAGHLFVQRHHDFRAPNTVTASGDCGVDFTHRHDGMAVTVSGQVGYTLEVTAERPPVGHARRGAGFGATRRNSPPSAWSFSWRCPIAPSRLIRELTHSTRFSRPVAVRFQPRRVPERQVGEVAHVRVLGHDVPQVHHPELRAAAESSRKHHEPSDAVHDPADRRRARRSPGGSRAPASPPPPRGTATRRAGRAASTGSAGGRPWVTTATAAAPRATRSAPATPAAPSAAAAGRSRPRTRTGRRTTTGAPAAPSAGTRRARRRPPCRGVTEPGPHAVPHLLTQWCMSAHPQAEHAHLGRTASCATSRSSTPTPATRPPRAAPTTLHPWLCTCHAMSRS